MLYLTYLYLYNYTNIIILTYNYNYTCKNNCNIPWEGGFGQVFTIIWGTKQAFSTSRNVIRGTKQAFCKVTEWLCRFTINIVLKRINYANFSGHCSRSVRNERTYSYTKPCTSRVIIYKCKLMIKRVIQIVIKLL